MGIVNPHFCFTKVYLEEIFGILGVLTKCLRKNRPAPMPEEIGRRIMHVSLPISQETVLMGSDTMPNEACEFVQGNNFSISINPENKQEADSLFGKLAEGGKVTMPLENTFWGAYFGMLTDAFGINWMLNYEDPSQQKEH